MKDRDEYHEDQKEKRKVKRWPKVRQMDTDMMRDRERETRPEASTDLSPNDPVQRLQSPAPRPSSDCKIVACHRRRPFD